MITHVQLRVGVEIHEKVSAHSTAEFVREAIQRYVQHLSQLRPGDVPKHAHLANVTVSVIEERKIYQHD
jgi:hypothetical protein